MQLRSVARPLRRALAQHLRHSSAVPACAGVRRTPPGPAALLVRCGVGAQWRPPHAAAAVGAWALPRRWCSSSAEEPSAKIKELVDQIASLTLLEAAQLTDALKDRLGISSAMLAPVGGAAPAAAAAPAEEAPPVVEKTHFTVKLDKYDAASKIKLIKEVRAITGLGLKEAKELVEGAPKEIKADMKKEEAEQLKAKLEAAGGVIVIE